MPTLAEHACLALVAQGVSHGWAIGSLLAPKGELGAVYTLSRPLTYRAIDRLVQDRLVRRKEPTGGTRDRATLTATATGRRVAQAWLDAPVSHVRDVRVELMLKLLLRQRAGQPVAPLVDAQLAALPFERLIDDAGAEGDLVHLWRREHARSVQAFLLAALHADPRETAG